MTPERIAEIEAAIREAGAFGRVTLILHNGRVAFIEATHSIPVKDGRQQELSLGVTR